LTNGFSVFGEEGPKNLFEAGEARKGAGQNAVHGGCLVSVILSFVLRGGALAAEGGTAR
jgi:hypothetical protein